MWQAIVFAVLFAIFYFIAAFIEGLRQSSTGEHMGYLALALWPAILSTLVTLLLTGIVSLF